MTSITQVAETMQRVFQEQADAIGKSSGFIQRTRKQSGSSFVTALVSDWMSDGGTTLTSLSQASANVGVQVSSQAVAQRFTAEAAQFMREMVEVVVQTMLSGKREESVLAQHFKHIYVQDSTQITLPGALAEVWQGSAGQSSVKIHVEWELLEGGLTQVQLSDGLTHDRRGLASPPQWEAGSLYLRDLGYFKLAEFAAMSAAQCGWVTRYKSGTCLYDEAAQPFDLYAWLLTVGEAPQAQPVLVGHKHLPAQLVARRATPEEADIQRQALREWERLKQRPASRARWRLVGWTIYLTNLSPDVLSVAQIATLYRLRWQIERLFRLWKNDLQLDTSRSLNPWRILCEFYAKLIAALVQHWCFLLADIHHFHASFQRAANVIRKKAWQWAAALPTLPALCHTLRSMCDCLRVGVRIAPSRSSPTTFQHLRAVGLT